MHVGIPKEIKIHEYRVGMTPAGVKELTNAGHAVMVEKEAGIGAGFDDAEYLDTGARIGTQRDVYAHSEMIVKVKEPQPAEYELLQPAHVLFTYLHLAANPALARALLERHVTAIAYETVTASTGSLPLLTPMSEVAGRMSVQVAAACLQRVNGGRGILLGGVPGVAPGKVVILGGGVAGMHAATIALGMGADVTVVDKSLPRLRELSAHFAGRIKTVYSTSAAIASLIATADVVIGAALIPGAAAPRLITREMLKNMQPGAVLVDIAIDQGGCFETSHPTTHADPIYVVDGIVHYCVANIPGAVPRTSTLALTNATLPYIKAIATHGVNRALLDDVHLANGLNVYCGEIAHPAVAQSLDMHYQPFQYAA
ncbi:MAG TPA: alanine dehydrogenase [Steroidobacteraceae bacterium]|nr:alanine dehydrogenase [Steroidobacteraceae bacterium]